MRFLRVEIETAIAEYSKAEVAGLSVKIAERSPAIGAGFRAEATTLVSVLTLDNLDTAI